MDSVIKNIFEKYMKQNNIEYYKIVPFDKCIVINENMLQKNLGDVTPKSVMICIVPYFTGLYTERNISLYAVSRDYHIFFKELFTSMMCEFNDICSNIFKGYTDSSPIAEVHTAAASGLGIIGDNGLLINEKHGSFVFIGEIITDYEFDEYDEILPIKTCNHCGKCKVTCPAKNECISKITQKRSELSDSEISLIQSHGIVWGCDICQLVCPHNDSIPLTNIGFFYDDVRSVLDENCEIDGRAYAWRGKEIIHRNIKILNQKGNK